MGRELYVIEVPETEGSVPTLEHGNEENEETEQKSSFGKTEMSKKPSFGKTEMSGFDVLPNTDQPNTDLIPNTHSPKTEVSEKIKINSEKEQPRQRLPRGGF